MSKQTIKCPSCGTSIDINEALSHQLEDKIKQQYSLKLAKEKEHYASELQLLEKNKISLQQQQKQMKDQIEKETNERLGQEKQLLETKLRKQIDKEQMEAMTQLQQELTVKSQQIQELNKSKVEIERLKREKDELESNIQAKTAHEFNQQLQQERVKIHKQVTATNELQLKEKEQQLEALKEQLLKAKQKAEQGSVQLQGEVQELAIEEWLTDKFPFDTIEEIKKGQRGADCLQVVHTREIQNCGKIYYESKRAKDFSQAWIDKLKADMREKAADIGVLVTEVYPKSLDRVGLVDGVWVCSYEEFKGLVYVLREQVIKIHLAMKSQENKSDKMSLLYGFLTSNEFKMQVEAIVDGFTQMQTDLSSEKRAMARIWKQREKQIEKVIDNTICMYGSIKGIAGNAISSIKTLELPFSDELDN